MKKIYLLITVLILFFTAFAKAQVIDQTETDPSTGSIFRYVLLDINRPSAITTTTPIVQNIIENGQSTGSITVTVSGGTPETNGNDLYTAIIKKGSTQYTPASINGSAASGDWVIIFGDLSATSPGQLYTLEISDKNGCTIIISDIEISQPEVLELDPNVTSFSDRTCHDNDGALTVRARGGIGPYSYQLLRLNTSTGIFDNEGFPFGPSASTFSVTLSESGTYKVRITDDEGIVNNLNTTPQFTISELSPVTFTIGTENDVSCFGENTGSVNVTVSGGNGSYNFSWTSGATEVSEDQNLTGVVAGSYTLTVTDTNGCTDIVTGLNKIATIRQPDAPLLITTPSGSIINPMSAGASDGSINIEVTGGTPFGTTEPSPYTYAWRKNGSTTPLYITQDIANLSEGIYDVIVTDSEGCTEVFSTTLEEPDALTVTIQEDTAILCNGSTGALEAIGNGGIPFAGVPYTYQWFNITSGILVNTGIITATANTLTAGDYRVIITDNNGITAQQDFTLTEPPAIQITTPIPTDVSCFGGNDGSISASASGGTGLLTYEWTKQGDPTFSENTQNLVNLTAGTYILSVIDENLCSITIPPIAVSEPTNPLEITNGIETDILINGQNTGAIDITVSGGTPTYSYSWQKAGDPTFTAATEDLTNLFAGTYTVTIRDANFYDGAGNEGCTLLSQNFVITEEDALVINITETGEILCNGETTALLSTVSGGVEPYLYQWSQEISGVFTELTTASATTLELLDIQSGTYQVEVTDTNGAVLTENFTIAVVPDIVISNIVAEEVKCAGELSGSITIDVTGGTGILTYVWTDEIGTTVETMQDLFNVGGGDYFLSVTDENGCSEAIGPITVDDNFTSLVIQEDALENLDGFETNDGLIDISVTGGVSPYSYVWSKSGDPTFNETTQDINSLSEGTYTVTVEDANECTINSTFVITQPELLEIVSITETNSNLCFGNNTADLEATVTGGIEGTYIYSWFLNSDPSDILSTTNILSNQPAGTYTLIVTDVNNNTDEDINIVINEPTEIIITGISTDILCNGEMTGAIDISVSGGTPGDFAGLPYQFSWSNGSTTEDLTDIAAGTYTINIIDGNNCQSSMAFTVAPPPPPLEIDTSLITNTSGFGLSDGAVSVSVIGGMPPYEYQWTNSIGTISITNPLVNVSAGTYTLVVTDSNGCTINPTDFEVNEPDELIVNIDIIPITCNGGFGELTAIVTGGVEPYSYNWTDSTGIEISTNSTSGDILAGTYNITVTDANGNSTITSESLLSILPITINTTTTDVTCFNANDGMIVLDVQGGSGGYDISFDGTIINSTIVSGLSGGTYTIIVTDQNDINCFITQSITVNEPEEYDITNILITSPSSANNDGSISLDVLGGIPPFTFEWQDQGGNVISNSSSNLSNSLTGLSEGDYTLTVTDSSPFNCTITNTLSIGLPGELLLDIQQTNGITCFNGSDGEITVTTNTGVNTYTWFDASSNPPTVIPGLVTPVIQVSAGVYFVEVFDAVQSITEISAPITITQPDPVIASIIDTTNTLCHDSSDGTITITASGGNGDYEYIYREVGSNFPITWVEFDNGNSATVEGLSSGDYEIRVRDGLGCTFNNNGVIINIPQTIIAPSELIISNSIITDVTGNGLSNGSISLTPVGGTPPYTYQWTDGNGTGTSTTNPLENITAGTYTLIVTDSNMCAIDATSFEVGEPDELIVTTTIQQVILCQGEETGNINAIATGGVPFSSTPNDYTFEWFNENNPDSIGSEATIENLPAGTYFVVVTDSNNNVTISNSIEIIEPPLLEVVLNADFVLCGDGNDWTITTTVTGGTGDYNYSWNTSDNTPDLINIIEGDYTVSVSDQNGCVTTAGITLTPPEPLTAVENIISTTCFDVNDGSISLTVSGGSPPYELLWDTGDITDTVNNLAAGIYQVSIIDDRGCEIINSYEITEPEEVIIDLGEDLTLCIDQTVILDATIPDESTYTWNSSNGFESTDATVEIGEAGTYTVTATNTSGCIVTDEIVIDIVNNPINAEFLVSTQVFTNESFVIVQVSEPFPDTVEWIIPETATIIAIDDDFAELSFDTPGVYELSIIISNGLCTDIRTKEVTVIEAEEFDIEVEESDGPIIRNFLTYPNPTNGNFTLDVELKEELPISAKIYSLNSNTPIDTRVFTGNDHYIEPYNLNVPPGVYFLVIEAPNMTTLKKLIIN